jgi:hypothetical protein
VNGPTHSGSLSSDGINALHSGILPLCSFSGARLEQQLGSRNDPSQWDATQIQLEQVLQSGRLFVANESSASFAAALKKKTRGRIPPLGSGLCGELAYFTATWFVEIDDQ